MNLYTSKCLEFYNHKKPTVGTDKFLSFIKDKYSDISLFVLSGGETDEIEIFMKKNNLIHYFDDILASSKLKSRHLIDQKATISDFFIGDSKSDLKMALNHPLNFILINGYQSKLSKPSKEDFKNISMVSPNLFNLIDFL